MLNKSPFSAFFHALKNTNSFKNNHVTDVTAQFWQRLQENPFKINRVTDVTDVTDVTAKKSQLDITFKAARVVL
jgi:hypothetical protein